MEERLPTKVFAKAGLDIVTSAMCKHQQRFRHDVQCSALVLNFNNMFSIGHLCRDGQSMNSPPSQILERCLQPYCSSAKIQKWKELTPEQKQSELERQRTILLATLDYLEQHLGGSFVYDQYDPVTEYYQQQKYKQKNSSSNIGWTDFNNYLQA